MGKYSIKELEKLSGIKAHTIRIWELRYNLLKPKRTKTNIRVYDDEQLKRILNTSLLLKKGFKISRISKMKLEDVNKLILNLDAHSKSFIEEKINGLIVSMIELNEEAFESIFMAAFKSIGFKETIVNLIYPFLNKIGIFWSAGKINPAQEHFVSSIIIRKIMTAIDNLPPIKGHSDSWLLYLPEDEQHEIGLLLAYYIIRAKGDKVIYLGQDVPIKDAEAAFNYCRPENVLLFFTCAKPENEFSLYLKKISALFVKANIYVSGNYSIVSLVKIPSNIRFLKSMNDLEDIKKG